MANPLVPGLACLALVPCALIGCDAADTVPRELALAGAGSVEAACVDTSQLVARRSLIETNKTVLQQFTMAGVLQAAITNSGSTGTALALHDRIFESFRPKAGGAVGVPHCDDTKTGGLPALNGYPIECPRADGGLVGALASWRAIALVNRFDLAPLSGSNCGEQRIVFANTAIGRDFVIFEAKIPNPDPAQGLAACRPIAEFWAAQSAIASATTRASRLKQAFLTGEPTLAAAGFSPFIRAQHFTSLTGQIRTNNFAQPPWTLREHKLALTTTDGVQRVTALPAPVAHDLHGPIWDDTRALANAATCRAFLLSGLSRLLVDDLNTMGLIVPKACWAGESRDDTSQDFALHLGNSVAFESQIAARLQELGSALTPTDIAERARFSTSCIGCHEQALGQEVGGGLVTPPSLGFVHVQETGFESCGDGTSCFPISPALKDVFLPHRLAVLQDFLDAGPCALDEADDLAITARAAVLDPELVTLGGGVVGSH